MKFKEPQDERSFSDVIETKILNIDEELEEEELVAEEEEEDDDSEELSEEIEEEEERNVLEENVLLEEIEARGKAEEILGSEEAIKKKKKKDEITFRWWIKPSIVYAFRHPLITFRLEKLMGSNCVKVTDREYMQVLQQRILEEYAASAGKRIKWREAEEMKRVKDLVLNGKVPITSAPAEMSDHPIIVIERICRRLIAERRAKIKVPKVNIPNHLYWDDTMDPPGGLSIEKGHVFRKDAGDADAPNLRVCNPPDRFLMVSDEDDIDAGYMLEQSKYEGLRYKDPNVKKIDQCESIDELYQLADIAIGPLKSLGT